MTRSRRSDIPQIFSSFPQLDLSLLLQHAPPIERLAKLEKACHSGLDDTRLFVYREDLASTFNPGGNKLRKLEYALPLAFRKGGRPTSIVAVGGLQSNCCRQTAQVAASLGIRCYLVLDELDYDDHSDARHFGNLQLMRLLGAEIIFASSEHDADRQKSLGSSFSNSADKLVKDLRRQGERVLFIPTGASDMPGSGLGYARFVFDLLQQEEQMHLPGSGRFDFLAIACASGSTLAGIIAGFRLAREVGWIDEEPRIVGVETFCDPVEEQRRHVLSIARDTAGMLGLGEDAIGLEDVVIDGRWTGGKYGHCDHATQTTIQLVAQSEGLILDPVYNGKSMTAVLEGVREGELYGNVLLINTGGQSVMSAYPGVERCRKDSRA
ncbi:tryptophan synthase beta subunit-like PLP-dependent enzyme [Dissoconium aciculare CBS 342.82]|uniref:Tryptophan synthase beta subunit-like PLP-dependent enzyme n=1 Tax=Dissoconium aciculare CBS 342.82 TaxID=1314786 RepID=A0A6J3MBH2_9PEZI|nr:tryptophan synthase beta subunit-like PLP-dependent enzyme [Dissoconium aciculare CBS 342.82]KAF1825213.1 tryptophan synthase beta subunit-like PLP-dependent enzyme [Dissoconium aciculare CBS 342.82]